MTVRTLLLGVGFACVFFTIFFHARMMRKMRNDNASFLFRYSFIRAASTYEFYLFILCITLGIIIVFTIKQLE